MSAVKADAGRDVREYLVVLLPMQVRGNAWASSGVPRVVKARGPREAADMAQIAPGQEAWVVLLELATKVKLPERAVVEVVA